MDLSLSFGLALALGCLVTCAGAATVKVDVNAMPRVVFTGDSQTCGCVGAWDYPQMLSWEMPVRVINTAVGGSNTTHLLQETGGGSVEVKQGEQEIKGTNVGWFAGPFPGERIRVGTQQYTIDRIVTRDYKERLCSIWITETAREDYRGTDYKVEAGWRVRIAEQKPDYVCFMFTVNDTGHKSETFLANLAELARRTRELGAQPIFLSGVPLMEASRGGSHAPGNVRSDLRATEIGRFCREQGIPFGDVFHALMALDEQATSVWVDTVHPTSDASEPILAALRAIFRDLGLAQAPYYLRGYRTGGSALLPAGDRALVPFAISQPRYSASGVNDPSQYGLAAIKAREEYGLLAAPDGDCVTSAVPIVLAFGVGKPGAATSAELALVAPSRLKVAWFDAQAKTWVPLTAGEGELKAALPAGALAGGTAWIGLEAEGKLTLDYAALSLNGAVAAYTAVAGTPPLAWPPEGDLAWDGTATNLIPNGSFTVAAGQAPTGWTARGPQCRYIAKGPVATGTGEFAANPGLSHFKCAGAQFTQTVRPLDRLEIATGPEGATGRFLVSKVVSDEVLQLRRAAKEAVAGVSFEVMRWSGCGAVPGGCAVQCRGDSFWEVTVDNLPAGRYRLGLFHRAYDPPSMQARGGPGDVVRVEVVRGAADKPVTLEGLRPTYQWQRAWLELDVATAGKVQVRLGARSATAVEYTGVSLERRGA